ncbi:polysaccharide biosynthesis protein, partial [Planococcus sp. SIMBA_143]
LARNMIKFSGFKEEEIGIRFSGIRPGEKLYEELLQKEEILQNQVYEKIYIGKTHTVSVENIDMLLKKLNSKDNIKEILI